MEKGVIKFVIFNDENFSYWKNWTHIYLLIQDHVIWEIVHETYVILPTLNNATQGEL
jgi:hypothetical protein